jgi:beta-glucosidase
VDSDDRGGDRDDLGLKPGDRTLVEAVTAENPRSVVVLIGGAAIAVDPWRERVGALLMAFYPGEQGGVALARVLFGDINPSGKLPFTVPKDMSQLPPWDNRSDSVEYGPYHGYTLLDRRRESPTYPFGFGRSYTTYRYQNVALETPSVRANGGIVRVSVDVTNTGPRAGEEVVQLYVGFPSPSAVERPVKLLRAFEKVPLAPGETKTVSLAVPVAAFAYYDTGGKAWVVERAAHTILVGPSSRAEDLLTATVLVVD